MDHLVHAATGKAAAAAAAAAVEASLGLEASRYSKVWQIYKGKTKYISSQGTRLSLENPAGESAIFRTKIGKAAHPGARPARPATPWNGLDDKAAAP